MERDIMVGMIVKLDWLAKRWLDYRIKQVGFNAMLDNERLSTKVTVALRAQGVENLRMQEHICRLSGRLSKYEQRVAGSSE